ncbi:hypothetical protein [Apilactobacillus timberlakei]|uniref:hypothetical protein n=1 Tax=Apilactobacillus timberlakei TaxID=2008380 RepID=UPI0015E85449|nr:hypothetical protein [Apilactobacillus timberlakei]
MLAILNLILIAIIIIILLVGKSLNKIMSNSKLFYSLMFFIIIVGIINAFYLVQNLF